MLSSCIYNVYIGDEQPAANLRTIVSAQNSPRRFTFGAPSRAQNSPRRFTFGPRTTVSAQNPSSAASTWYKGETIRPRATSSGKFALIPDNGEYVGISQEDGDYLNKSYKKAGEDLMKRGD